MHQYIRKRLKIQRNKYDSAMKKAWLERVDSLVSPLVRKGVEKGIFSGAAVGIYHYRGGEENRFIRTYGRTRNDAYGLPLAVDTMFDLASLTKPLCTVLSILCLVERKKIHLQSRLAELVIQTISKEQRDISVQQLLSHSSGLPAYKPYYKGFKPVIDIHNKSRLVQAVLNEKLAYRPVSNCVYSDLGYILLGVVIEAVSGLPLDTFFLQEITTPLKLEKKIQFRPPVGFLDKEEKNIVATEFCPWRGKILQGEVHDEHSWLLNGIAGHAGLFGSIEGVLSLVEHLLNQWGGKFSHPGYSNDLLARALTRQFANQTWCLGFDSPSPVHSSAGKYLSQQSAGHLGYTGTSFWMDPERELAIVLLSNRIHPTRKNEQIKQFRPLFHDTVVQAVQGK
jgi:serine-type D-Ala-D-Ala carboxypeptidase